MNIKQIVSSELERPVYRKYNLKGRHMAERNAKLTKIDITNALY
jgi:hypothetical protein